MLLLLLPTVVVTVVAVIVFDLVGDPGDGFGEPGGPDRAEGLQGAHPVALHHPAVPEDAGKAAELRPAESLQVQEVLVLKGTLN